MDHGAITQVLHEEVVTKGDAFFISPGTVHAIGRGIVLAEIQQTSDITYRIYDWDRPGLDGALRTLHTDLALEAINFKSENPKLQFEEAIDSSALICRSPYFETNILALTKSYTKNLNDIDSFIVYMCTEGAAVITALGISETIKKGDTLLLPACCQSLTITTEGVTLLEVYVPHTNIK
jgi:mannose-6-phosphate isomerase